MIVVSDASVLINLDRGLIPAVSPCLRELVAAGFWLSEDLIARVLKQVDE